MTVQAHRINIEAGQQSVFDALSTAQGWSRWFTPEVTGDFTEGSEIVCRLNGRPSIRLRDQLRGAGRTVRRARGHHVDSAGGRR
jgi:uncharacterized protein YndB with AHSA1/START domain